MKQEPPHGTEERTDSAGARGPRPEAQQHGLTGLTGTDLQGPRASARPPQLPSPRP